MLGGEGLALLPSAAVTETRATTTNATLIATRTVATGAIRTFDADPADHR